MPAFTTTQFEFIIDKLIEGDEPIDIAATLNRRDGTTFTERDVEQAKRRHLTGEWAAMYDSRLAAFEAGAQKREYSIAWLFKEARKFASRNANAAEAREYVELAEKLRGTLGGADGDPKADQTITWKIVKPEGDV